MELRLRFCSILISLLIPSLSFAAKVDRTHDRSPPLPWNESNPAHPEFVGPPPPLKCPIDWSHITTQFENQRAFLMKMGPIAERYAEALNLPLDGFLAQMALESGWGESELAVKYNNYGGIKARDGLPETPPIYTKEKNGTSSEMAKFLRFDTPEQYVRYKAEFLSSENYRKCLGRETYDWADCLGEHKYHQDTPSVYAKKVSKISREISSFGVKCKPKNDHTM